MPDTPATHRIGAFFSSPVTLAMVVAFVVGGVLIAITGTSPIDAYSDMFRGAVTGSGLRNSINRAIPVVGMALAISVSFRAGILNLGAEGQMVVGGLAGAAFAIFVPGPGPLIIVGSLVVGALGGALWALMAALGQTRMQLPILITSLLLNYPARALTGYLVRFPLADDGSVLASTPVVPEGARMPVLPIFGGVSSTVILVLALVAVAAVVYRRSVFGYETEMIGLNGRFSRYGGIHVEARTVGVMLIAGAVSGLIGTHMVIGDAYRYVDGEIVVAGFAWTGLMVSLLAFNRPLPILAAGTFFAALQIGGLAMQRNSGVSWQIAQVIQAVVIVALSARIVLRRRTKAPTPAPDAAAVGEV